MGHYKVNEIAETVYISKSEDFIGIGVLDDTEDACCFLQEEAANGHQLQQQVTALLEREGQLQQALREAQQHAQDR